MVSTTLPQQRNLLGESARRAAPITYRGATVNRVAVTLVLTLVGAGLATVGAFFIRPAIGVLVLGTALYGIGLKVGENEPPRPPQTGRNP